MKRIFIPVLAVVLAMAIADEAKEKTAKAKRPNIAEGKKTFQTSCMVCHGEKGKGDGPAGAALNPHPRNFTDTAFITKEPKSKMYNVISEGGKKNGYSPLMVSWKKMLKPDQIDNVLAYVLTFSEDSTKAITQVMEKDKEAKVAAQGAAKEKEKTEKADKAN